MCVLDLNERCLIKGMNVRYRSDVHGAQLQLNDVSGACVRLGCSLIVYEGEFAYSTDSGYLRNRRLYREVVVRRDFAVNLWLMSFEDGDVRTFLEDLEDVAEVVGVKTDRGKLAALRTLVKGRAKAVLDAARRGPAKMEWDAAKETLVAAFDSPADSQEAMRRFKEASISSSACRGTVHIAAPDGSADDIVIYSNTESEHAGHIDAVLNRIKNSGLRINADKSQLGRSSVVLLGHKVGQEAVAPNSKRTLRQFLGQTGYYSRFVKNFHSIASPLYELLRKDKKFEWTDDAQRAFKRVQQAMNEQQLTLKLPNTKETFIVATDASDRGIGAVLKQKEGVIEYASRVLTPTEQKYSTIEKECLAIVWALDKWRPYLLGQQFHVETDHKPLEWIMTARDPRGKLARWALRLQEYDFTINHVPGLSNCVADFLSRPQVDDELPKVTVGVNGLIMEQDPQTLVRLQRQDKVLRKVIEALARGVRIPTNTKDEELKIIASQWKRVGLNSAGVLTWQRGVGHPCVVVIPRQLRRKVVADCHEMAHTGCTRTYDLLQQRAYWPKMKEDVTTYVLACQQCQLLKSDNRGAQQPLQPIPVSEIGELWSMDLMGPFPLSARGNQYVLVMTEHFTRWIEATGVPDQRASTVGDMVMEHIVANHGVPKAILTDQGPCFESEEFRTRMQQLGIKRIRTTPYHPQTNGLTERNNRTVKEWVSSKGGDWESALPLVLLAHRASVQASTKKSPFQLMYGRTPRLPVDQDIEV
ncbi:uncharacterized protein DEA37_0014875 [Paragonimus westermani]|uniref:Integrase catalytic domain-containing protein n=1 Tax=Paragonimus westermani TaxID=34504 RepID=A0A5J4P2A3_9TREM|nr:uncharacterized protein DEA37_0014875 [Paragonimus westermani]